MKKLLFAIGIIAIVCSGCKENDTSIYFGTKFFSENTDVVTPVPTAAPHQVLVEEFSGQSCPNCPPAHTALDALSASNPGRINVVSMYTNSYPQQNPPPGAKYDFQDSTAANIEGAVYGDLPGLPCVGVDRIPVNGSIAEIGSGLWSNNINTELTVTDSLNLTISSSYNASTKVATITANVTYTQPVSTPQNLSIVIVEDSMVDIQEDNTAPSGYDSNYLFLDVFRDMVSSAPWGDALQVTAGNNTKEAGRFFQKVYAYTLPSRTPAIVAAHCRVIAFVNNTNGTDVHVMQSAQCPFAP